MEWVFVDDIFCVTKLLTPKGGRRQGGASNLIRGIKHPTVCLQAHSDGSVSDEVLINFYSDMGFKHLGKGYMFRTKIGQESHG